jgi:hypothetical protein
MPIIPKIKRFKPPKNTIVIIMDAQPETSFPVWNACSTYGKYSIDNIVNEKPR